MVRWEGFDLAVECVKWLPDVYRGEFYDFKTKKTKTKTKLVAEFFWHFMQGCLEPITQPLGTIRVKGKVGRRKWCIGQETKYFRLEIKTKLSFGT